MEVMQSDLNYITVEPVGRSFMVYYLKNLIYNEQKTQNSNNNKNNNNNNNNINNNSNQTNKPKKDKKKTKKKQKQIEVEIDWKCDLDDYYALLGIKKHGMSISQENLKKAYRKVSLLCHPDKAPKEYSESAENRYKAIQKAFDILQDPYKKTLYDSEIEFDDSVPSYLELSKIDLKPNERNKKLELMLLTIDHEIKKIYKENNIDIDEEEEEHDSILNSKELEDSDDESDNYLMDEINNRILVNEEEFYKLFNPYFRKWSIYSRKSSPMLGNNSAKYNNDVSIKKFYNFWNKFNSWRTFYHLPEINASIHNLENAENNKEKKWMNKENNNLQQPFKKEESLKIKQLIDDCYKRDPRITNQLINDRKQYLIEVTLKKIKKYKKLKEKQLKLEEIERKKNEIKLKKLKEEEQKRKEMQKLRDDLKNLPLNLRKLMNDKYFLDQKDIKNEDINMVCFHANNDELRDILNQNSNELKLAKFREILIIANNRFNAKKEQEIAKKLKEEQLRNEKNGYKPWTKKEINDLVIAVQKYPGGTIERWEKIRKCVGKQRKVDEIIAKCKEMSAKRKQKAKNNDSSNTNTNNNNNNNNNNTNDDIWTKQQQSELENALKFVRTLPANEKWDKVAEMVSGKTKQQCVDRFKWIRQKLLAQKQNQ